jgi:hypothetical protein
MTQCHAEPEKASLQVELIFIHKREGMPVTKKIYDVSTRFGELVRQYKANVQNRGESEFKDPTELFLRASACCPIIPGSPLDDAIAVAFEKTGFNRHDPLEWKLLLGLFCLAHYAQWPKRSAPKQWTLERLDQLDQHAAEVRARRGNLSDTAVAIALTKSAQHRSLYGKYSASLIRERLGEARTAKHDFETLMQNHVAATRRLYALFGKEWTNETETEGKARKCQNQIVNFLQPHPACSD